MYKVNVGLNIRNVTILVNFGVFMRNNIF